VTVAYRYLWEKQNRGLKQSKPWERWCSEVRHIFQEENLHYRVDERGGVHFSFDVEFDRSIAATIAALQGARYKAALTNFEGAMSALGKGPPDGKAAIRGTFDAAEGRDATDGSGGVETGALAAESSRNRRHGHRGRDQSSERVQGLDRRGALLLTRGR
jgi:hypothetical protein